MKLTANGLICFGLGFFGLLAAMGHEDYVNMLNAMIVIFLSLPFFEIIPWTVEEKPVPVTPPFSLSELEYKREKKFQDAHYKKHKTDRRRIIQYPTGIGNKVVVECLTCKKKDDISDYDSW